MKRDFVGFALILVVLSITALYANRVDKLKYQTVLISNESLGGVARGTGVLLDSTHVLTCAHLAKSFGDNLWVFTYPVGKVAIGHPDALAMNSDLTILVLESSVTVQTKPVFQDKYSDGDPITAVGNVLGTMKWFMSKGIISGSDGQFLFTDVLINPGNSGGPWFNDKGEIVAITSWRIGPNSEKHYPGFAGGISAKRIKEFLESYQNPPSFSLSIR